MPVFMLAKRKASLASRISTKFLFVKLYVTSVWSTWVNATELATYSAMTITVGPNRLLALNASPVLVIAAMS